VTRFEEKVSAGLASFVVALVPYAFTMLLITDVPPNTRDIVMVLVGVIAANATQAVQHRFGSNPASQRKDDTIQTLANTASQAQAALAPVLGAPADAVEIKPGETATVTAKPAPLES
jgi:hypothetical protein